MRDDLRRECGFRIGRSFKNKYIIDTSLELGYDQYLSLSREKEFVTTKTFGMMSCDTTISSCFRLPNTFTMKTVLST